MERCEYSREGYCTCWCSIEEQIESENFYDCYGSEDEMLECGMLEAIIAEWVPDMKAYRLYDPDCPQKTIAYEKDKDSAMRHETEGCKVFFE